MIEWGENDSRLMPSWLFPNISEKHHATAIKANYVKQNFSICPRYWYLDTTSRCVECKEAFTFTVREQRKWYEEYFFWVDSYPIRCVECRKSKRMLKEIRKSYDANILNALEGDDLELKVSTIKDIDQLYEYRENLPKRINENRKRLTRQIEKTL